MREKVDEIEHKESTLDTNTTRAEDQSSLLVDPVLRLFHIETVDILFDLEKSKKGGKVE